jgi:imidazole glycerol-phosphate synthase subunit HisF
MPLAIRIIPRLDIKGPNLVKGINLEGLRVLGKPESFAKFYYEQGADELFYQDVVASLYGRNSLHDIISRTAKEIFIPLTVGGGIRTIDDISNILKAGADKVSINTAAIENPNLISSAANFFGSSTIVASIEAIKQSDGSYKAFTDNGRNFSGKDVISWAKELEQLGVGEISLTSVDQEGSGKGFDLMLANQLYNAVSIPIVIHGGAGSKQQVLDLAKELPISGIAISSLFHYDYILHNRQLEGFENQGNIDFLKSNQAPFSIESISINKLKLFLMKNNIDCRIDE